MLKIGERVRHSIYGNGETISTPDQNGGIDVAFDNEFDELVEEETDEYVYTDIIKTRFKNVHITSLEKLNIFLKERNPNCHNCGKNLFTKTHKECHCGWLVCECGSCGCDYIPKQQSS